MFGCLRRLGCLVLILVGVILYLTRDRWLTLVRPARPSAVRAADGVWEPLTPAGAERARQAVAALQDRHGPVFENLHPGDLAAYVFEALRRQLPPDAQNVEAAVFGDQLHVRALVSLSDFGGARTLGPLTGFLAERDTVQFGGSFDIVRAGLAEYHIQQIRLRQLPVPGGMIPKLVAQIRRGPRPAGVADDALALEVPAAIGDVRIGRGRVTLYKNTP